MALPETVRVKLSPEDAGAITLSPVIGQVLRLTELVDIIVEAAGKDVERLRKILRAGTVLSGATRYRWEGWEVSDDELRSLLARFPDPEPERPFAAERCLTAVFEEENGRRTVIPHAVGARRRFLRRSSFWDALMRLASSAPLAYHDYSYQQKADCYRLELTAEAVQTLRAAASRLAYRSLARRLQAARLARLELFVTRTQ